MLQTAFPPRPGRGQPPARRTNRVAAVMLITATLSSMSSAFDGYESAGSSSLAAVARDAKALPRVTSAGVMPRANRPSNKVALAYEPVRKQDDQSAVPEIEMFVGESRVFPALGLARIAVGSAQVITASALDDDQVIMFANGVGNSTLFLWHRDGRHQKIKVTVAQGDTARIAREVSAFLGKIPNATVSIVGDKVIVEGDELSDANRDKIAELAKRSHKSSTSPAQLVGSRW